MTKGMAARAGFFSEFLASNHKGNARHTAGEGPLSPVGGACRPPFFLQVLRCKFEEKKITLWACRPMGGRPGGIFEIIQNGHIFLKFLFF